MILKPFQVAGAQFLASRTRALLADEPGVGKTAQVITAAKQLKAPTVRVVCPAVGMEHWRREFTRWAPSYRPVLEIWSYDQARVMARAGMQGALTTADILVLDECHYAKNPDAARTMAVFGKGGLGWYGRRIWALSGTPAPNNVAELWPMLRAYGATKMDYEQFKRHFCIVDALGKVRGSRPEAMAELRAILKPFTLRRKKADVLPELGAIDIQPWYVTPSAALIPDTGFEEAARREEAALRKAIKNLPPEELLTFLAGHHEFATVRRYNAMLKVPAVYQQVKFEIENGLLDKVVIYGHHKEPLNILGRQFKESGIGAIVINGDTPAKERDALIQSWKRPAGPQVNLSSITVAGTVLDYTAAHQVIALEMDWVPGNNAQAWQRPHRHGQKYPVTVRVANGSPIDEVINDVVARKTKELAAVFD